MCFVVFGAGKYRDRALRGVAFITSVASPAMLAQADETPLDDRERSNFEPHLASKFRADIFCTLASWGGKMLK